MHLCEKNELPYTLENVSASTSWNLVQSSYSTITVHTVLQVSSKCNERTLCVTEQSYDNVELVGWLAHIVSVDDRRQALAASKDRQHISKIYAKTQVQCEQFANISTDTR